MGSEHLNNWVKETGTISGSTGVASVEVASSTFSFSDDSAFFLREKNPPFFGAGVCGVCTVEDFSSELGRDSALSMLTNRRGEEWAVRLRRGEGRDNEWMKVEDKIQLQTHQGLYCPCGRHLIWLTQSQPKVIR